MLGIDTSLRSTGVGIVEADGNRYRALCWGRIRNPAGRLHTACLEHIYNELDAMIRENTPAVAAVEGIFFSKNVRTAVTLGQARGVVLAVCARAGIPVYEYSPRSVKQSVTGNGNAQKEQVIHMVKLLLGVQEALDSDSADALAMAICHLHHQRPGLPGGKAV